MTDRPHRRIARALMRHAARVMPSSDWGAAMQNELEAIEDDRVALNWAVGCVAAGYEERLNVLLQSWYARAALACLIALLALREFFAPLLIFAYRMNYLGLAHFLGLRTGGDDYRRLVPIMDATPFWVVALWAAAGLLFLVALWQMLRRTGASHVPFFLGAGLDLAGVLAIRSIEAATGVVVNPVPLVRLAGFLLTFSVGFVLWWMAQKRTRTVS